TAPGIRGCPTRITRLPGTHSTTVAKKQSRGFRGIVGHREYQCGVQVAGLTPVVTQLTSVWNKLTTSGVGKVQSPEFGTPRCNSMSDAPADATMLAKAGS